MIKMPPPTINTEIMGNLSKLSKARLSEIDAMIGNPDVLVAPEELLIIAKELVEHAHKSSDKVNLERMVYLLEEKKPVFSGEIQNVLSDYVERSIRGKKEGGKRKARSTRRRKGRKQTRKLRRL
jgi:hypothetical protein